MNRTGLVIALAIGAVVGVVFAVWPQLDVAISRPFFNETYRVFPIQYSLVARPRRDLFTSRTAPLAPPLPPHDRGACRPGVHRTRHQARAAAPAHADLRARRALAHHHNHA